MMRPTGAPLLLPPSGDLGFPDIGSPAGGSDRGAGVQGVAGALAGGQCLDDVLRILTGIIIEATGSERAVVFLHDAAAGDLTMRVDVAGERRELRSRPTDGIAGRVFVEGAGMVIHNAYAHPLFNRAIDGYPGYLVRSLASAPIRGAAGGILGVLQCVNKRKGCFDADDLDRLTAIGDQAVGALRFAAQAETYRRSLDRMAEFLVTVAAITSEIDLNTLLDKAATEAARLLGAERATVFLHDTGTEELWARPGDGGDAADWRMPASHGVAGAAFTTCRLINIAHAYADLRFDPAHDGRTGFFTRSVLCAPIVNRQGRTIGVAEVLNRQGGPFDVDDEQRLGAFAAQMAIALENARLFNEVETVKRYRDNMLQSMSNGVLTIDAAGRIVTCNSAGLGIVGRADERVVGRPAAEVFADQGAWMSDRLQRVLATRAPQTILDWELIFDGNTCSVNLTILPLIAHDDTVIGTMVILDDITREKRVRSTLSRYVDRGLVAELLENDDALIAGRSTVSTIMFCDIRRFSNLSEQLGPQGTVAFLNEYFTFMVDCLQREGGTLDKFIGDGIMAVFGAPLGHGDDEDRAVRAGIAMLRAVRAWNVARAAAGQPAIAVGIGINTDLIVSGNIGSPKRMDYTVIGDGVNLAARLERACKHYRAPILISDRTLNRLEGSYRIRPVDVVVLPGRTEPVAVHEILDHHTEESFRHLDDALDAFRHGFRAYQRGDFVAAIGCFRDVLALNPADGLSALLADRCRTLARRPPAGEWRATWTLTDK